MKNVYWVQLIPGCFGEQDMILGSHPRDRERAKEMLKAAIDAGVAMSDIVSEVKHFMEKKGASPAHIAAQVAKIKNLRFE